jgi:hypothetical protein
LRGEVASKQSDLTHKRVSHNCDPFEKTPRGRLAKNRLVVHGSRMTLRHVNTSQEKIARIHIRMLKTLRQRETILSR